jgi:predicted ATPase/class 3 adenylate cyclase/tetratricopeptide (TPR) repeat protein
LKPVVFVMTDVVGSTALWEAHGDSMRDALEVHDGLVHGVMESAGGRVFKHTGDGMIAVFDDADAALIGSLAAIDALAAKQWGETGTLAVRVSVHAGSASERDGDFFGPPVNKVARINGVGHPSQVLVSDVARQLMSEPAGTDLGVHQLRDLSEPVRLWQFDDGAHPSLRTLKKARHNLPVMSTEFIGRQAEVDELRSLVDHHRLVTITGVGGCGKTRLAVEVGAAMSDRFPGGVWFADLTAERDGDKVGDRALGALGLFGADGADVGGPVGVLNDATSGAATLLIVDNCEHLIDDVADFAVEVLGGAESVTVLATSRESLSVDGERVWRIPNLHDAAVELFVDRAAAVGVAGLDDHLDRIEEICAQLDDIPLAIELAAARVSSLSIDELAARLDDRFSLLGGGRGRRRQRQQTLQTMMDWSYGLLASDEQAVLNQLAVFAGSFPLSGVEAVAASADVEVLDVLDSLVEQSLVVPSVDSGRYRLLETVRLYALDQLMNTEQLAAARDRHLVWMVGLFGRERFLSSALGEAWELDEQKAVEVDNATAAMEWAEQTGEQDALLDLFIGGITIWGSIGSVAVSWLDRIPKPPTNRPELRIDWLTTEGHIRYGTGDYAGCFEQQFEAATILDELMAADLPFTALPIALLYRSLFMAVSGDHEAALRDCDRLLELQIDGEVRLPEWASLQARSIALEQRGDPDALAVNMEAAEVSRTLQRMTRNMSLTGVALHLSIAGRFDEALPAALECLDSPVLTQSFKIRVLPAAVGALARLGRYEEALQITETDFGPMIDVQRQALRANQLTALALLLRQLGRLDRSDHVASVAVTQQDDRGAVIARALLADAVGGDEELAALPTPASADLTAARIDALIDDVIAETRDHINTGTAGLLNDTAQ